MTKIFLVILVLLFLSEGTGTFIQKRLGIVQTGFAAPIGFATILACSQILYYPSQLFHLSFLWVIVSSFCILAIAFILTIFSLKDILITLRNKNILLLLVVIGIFLVVLKQCSIDLDFSDSTTYLNYISLNINAPSLNLYDLTNGIRGAEWDLFYLFQGYFHFSSFICWLVNIQHYLLHQASSVPNMVIVVWGMGTLFQILMTMTIFNIVDSFRIDQVYFRYGLMIFAVFFLNFSYWNISFAWYGNTFRNLFILLLVFYIHIWLSSENESVSYLLLPSLFSGLASSSSFLFMGFAVLYALATHLFIHKYPRAFERMYILICPLVLYASAFISRVSVSISVGLLIIYFLLFGIVCTKKILVKEVTLINQFFYSYVKYIFYYGIPLLFAIGSLISHLIKPDALVTYTYFLRDFRHLDMITDYTFLHADWYERIYDVIRWVGIYFILKNGEKDGYGFIRTLTLVLLVFFLNPLCTILLTKTLTGIVYYRNYMVLFNYFTEILILVILYKKMRTRRIAVVLLTTLIIVMSIYVNAISFIDGTQLGQYWVYIKSSKVFELDHVYKIHPDEKNAVEVLREEVKTKNEMQPIVISQSGVTISYIPEIYQIFGPRENYYANSRVNDEFYQLAKRHYSWVKEDYQADYRKSCSFIEEYKVDYLLIEYWENSEFDIATDECSESIYVGSNYKVKKVKR